LDFPCLISVPHGGTGIPPEVSGIILLSEEDILRDGDPFTPELYSIPAASVVVAEIARAVVDLNRSPEDLPPQNPDGVIKSTTCFGKRVYKRLPTGRLLKLLLRRYYFPYHRRIKAELRRKEVLIAFDCHSMSPYPPPIAGDSLRRPAICLGNNHGKACPPELTELLATCFREVFELPQEEVSVNKPFAGGYITRSYGGKPKPWIQIEIRRDIYMDWEGLRRSESLLKSCRGKVEKTLRLFFERANL